MLRKTFNENWEIVPNEAMLPSKRPEGKRITLPYDVMLQHERAPGEGRGGSTGYYPDAICTLIKRFTPPTQWQDSHVVFEFEGVYANGMVYINNDFAGSCPHGYTAFAIDADHFLQYGMENEIKVVAKTRKDSRWYTGMGLHRGVNLMVGGLIHIRPDGYRITTPEVDDIGAVVSIASTLINLGHRNHEAEIRTAILDADEREVAYGEEIVTLFCGNTETLRQRLYLPSASRWDIDSPYLYTARTQVYVEGVLQDESVSTFGVRTLSLDPLNGLRINGKMVKLRGACVHHDNGVLGAAAIPRAEERRVEILKKAGFNAVRSAHNPISRAFLDACDRHGMVVMDEVTDIWTRRKTDYDYSTAFPYHWPEVVASMVDKDFNHPSVILYSIGNEIPETGSAHGARAGRKLAEAIRELDPTRYTINSIQLMLSLLHKADPDLAIAEMGGADEINGLLNQLGGRGDVIANSPMASRLTRESFATVDVAGYNYATTRYEPDKQLYPNRVLCGSETFPKQIANNWKVIMENNHVIGDFTWTGWDYLGEAGIGKMEYEEDGAVPGFLGAYPWYIAYCGDIDIIGHRRPVSYYRQIVFGLRKEPYIAVRRPENYGKKLISSRWDFVDGISSWTWPGFEGKPVEIEVYAEGDRVELQLNGAAIASGPLVEYKALLNATYRPGELTAVTYRGDTQIGRTAIQTAEDALQLRVDVDRNEIRADDTDLAYLMIELTDARGVVNTAKDRAVRVRAEGAGVLAGLGSGNPKSEETFHQDRFTTFDGRLLAVIRPTGQGEITVSIEAEGCEKQTIRIQAG